MKRLIALAAVAAFSSPVYAQDSAFNEDTVAAMKDGIVIEAPWGVSMKEGEIIVFMTIHNGGEDTDIIKAVTSDVAEKAMLAKFDGGPLLNAEAVENLETPKGEATSLDQDGYHVVLTDLNKSVENGDSVPLTLEFEGTGELPVLVSITVMQ